MSPLFGKKCPNCDTENNHDAVFCKQCGSPFANKGKKVCGVCGEENKQDSLYCKNCGRPLSANEEVQIQGNHWSRRGDDFAARLEVTDLPGLFSKKLQIETGTQALVYANGVPQEILPPGVYALDSVGITISNWLQGIPKSATILLVDAAPSEVVIDIANRFTSDPLPISLKMRMVVEVKDAAKFLLTALRGRERYSLEDLRQYIQPEVAAAVDQYLSKHTLEQLVQNTATRSELELVVEEALRVTFSQYGLKLISLRTSELDLEAYDKIKGITGHYSLIVSEGEAEVSGKQKLLELQKKVDLQELMEETAKVEQEARKVELYQRMRQAAMSDKMNEVRSEEDFAKFLDDIDRQKLLAEKEKQDLLRGWREETEDHNRARAFLLATAEVEEKYHLKAIEIKGNGDLAVIEQDYQLDRERKRAELTLEIEEKKWRAALEQRKTEELQDIEEARQGIDLLLYLKRGKLDLQLEEERARVEIEIQRMDAEHRLEMERLQTLSTLSIEALIAASPAEQGRILQDLKHAELMQSMSEEQILAMAAAKSPEIGKVFEAKYQAIAEGNASEHEREIYERLIAGNKESQVLLIETQKDAMNRLQQMSEHNIEAMRDVSKAYAQQTHPPVVFAGAGTEQGQKPSGALDKELKRCPACGRMVEANSRYCRYCNNEFKDMKFG